MIVGAAQKTLKYLKEYDYRCPTDPRDGFMHFAFQMKMTFFQLFSSIPQAPTRMSDRLRLAGGVGGILAASYTRPVCDKK